MENISVINSIKNYLHNKFHYISLYHYLYSFLIPLMPSTGKMEYFKNILSY